MEHLGDNFCGSMNIEVHDFNALHAIRRGKASQQDEIIVEHFYRFDIFYIIVDTQLHELNSGFNDNTVNLIILTSSILDPKEMRASLRG